MIGAGQNSKFTIGRTAGRVFFAGILLLLSAPTSWGDVCLLKRVSASQIRGNVGYLKEILSDIPVQVWKSDSRGLKISLVAEYKTETSGYFSFSGLPSGWYRLAFPVNGFEGDDFLVQVRGRNLFRWVPSNWLEIGLGLPTMNCPKTSIRATRSRAMSRNGLRYKPAHPFQGALQKQ
jgi:hypothetical protein